MQRLFRYKAWANDELLTRLAALESDSSITGLAIKALSHAYVVDRIFAAHLKGKTHAYTSANLNEIPTLEELSADIRKSDREYIEYVSSLDGDQLSERIDFVFTDGARGLIQRRRMASQPICMRQRHRREGGLPLRIRTQGKGHTMHATIYHNPQCGTSRNTLAILRHAGIEPTVIEYLKTPPDRATLLRLLADAGVTPRQAVRENGTPFEELGLGDPSVSDEAMIEAMLRHPILIQRPFVVTERGTRLCRPSEVVLQIIPPLATPFTKEDGEVVGAGMPT